MTNLDHRRVLRRPLTYTELRARLAKLSGNKENDNAVTRWLDANKGKVRRVEIDGGLYYHSGWLDNLGDKKRPQDCWLFMMMVMNRWIKSSPDTMTFESLEEALDCYNRFVARITQERDFFLAIYNKMAREPVEDTIEAAD